jgi:hypothetical protein
MKRKRFKIWVMLQRFENGKITVIYEPLRKKQIIGMIKNGWELL